MESVFVMDDYTKLRTMKIAYVLINSEQNGFRWSVTEEAGTYILAESQVVYSKKLDAFLAGADVARILGYAPRQHGD